MNAPRGKHGIAPIIFLFRVQVHPQAAPVVCKNTLELLISLARSFSIHFLPGVGGAAAGGSSSSAAPLTVTPSSSSDNTSSSTEVSVEDN